MKNNLKKILFVLIMFLSFINFASAYNYDGKVLNSIKENEKISYSITKKFWSRIIDQDDIVFTKCICDNSYNLSKYQYSDNLYDTNTTYEFLYRGKLYGYNKHLLKFYQLDFDGNKITTKEIGEKQLKEFFPDVEFIYLSHFVDNKITLNKFPLIKKTYLLLNDTPNNLNKYNFENLDNSQELIFSIIDVSLQKKLIYSHPNSENEMYPEYEINIKNVYTVE